MWRIKYNRSLYETLIEKYIRWFEHLNRENRALLYWMRLKSLTKKLKLRLELSVQALDNSLASIKTDENATFRFKLNLNFFFEIYFKNIVIIDTDEKMESCMKVS